MADICYLAPEGAPHVFRAPPSALEGLFGDRRGYNFDGCAPEVLLATATVEQGRVAFPGGSACRLLVLPAFETMTPALLRRIEDLVAAGATVVGSPPDRSPSLSDYPQCDAQIHDIVQRVWGEQQRPAKCRDGNSVRGKLSSAATCGVAEDAGPRTHPITRAKWIWFPEGNPASSAPPSQRFFHRVFALDAGERVAAAELEMTADNAFQCGSTATWRCKATISTWSIAPTYRRYCTTATTYCVSSQPMELTTTTRQV